MIPHQLFLQQEFSFEPTLQRWIRLFRFLASIFNSIHFCVFLANPFISQILSNHLHSLFPQSYLSFFPPATSSSAILSSSSLPQLPINTFRARLFSGILNTRLIHLTPHFLLISSFILHLFLSYLSLFLKYLN